MKSEPSTTCHSHPLDDLCHVCADDTPFLLTVREVGRAIRELGQTPEDLRKAIQRNIRLEHTFVRLKQELENCLQENATK